MTFMQNLAANPSGGVYGQPGPSDDQGALSIVSQLKNREMQDFKEKANFMADLSLKQNRLSKLYDTQQSEDISNKPQGSQPNVIMAQDPNQLTGYQKGELSVRQQGNNLESQRINQQGKLGQEALNIKGDQEKLNQQKSDQINAQKTADMQRKIEESNQKIQLAQDKLQQSGDNAAASLQAHKDMAAAVEERHKLELAQKDAQFEKTKAQHQQTIDNLTEQLKQRGRSQTTTEINADGTKKTVTTNKGDAADTINVVGKDGKTYPIPKDKLDDWNENHKPEGEE